MPPKLSTLPQEPNHYPCSSCSLPFPTFEARATHFQAAHRKRAYDAYRQFAKPLAAARGLEDPIEVTVIRSADDLFHCAVFQCDHSEFVTADFKAHCRTHLERPLVLKEKGSVYDPARGWEYCKDVDGLGQNPLPAETAPAAATGERRSARKRAAETPAIADSNELNVPSSKRNRQTPLSPAPSRTLNNHRNRETPAFTEPINTSSRTRTRPIKPEPRHTSFVITSSPPPEAHQPLTNPIQTPRRKIKAEPRAYTPSMPATPAPTPQSGANQSNIAQMKEKLREEYRKKAYEESLKGMTDNGYDMEAGNTRREWLRKWFRESMEMLEEAEREY